MIKRINKLKTEFFLEYVLINHLHINPLITDRNESLYLENYGKKNNLEGPDYTEAVAFINKLKIKTDIEIELNRNDWYNHKHYINKLYENTNIQIYFYDNQQPKNKVHLENYHIPAYRINLSEQLIYPFDKIYNDWLLMEQTKNIKVCNIEKIDNKIEIYKFIYRVGLLNLENKIRKIENSVKETGILKTLIILFARALGYGANKRLFTEIGLNIDSLQLKKNNFETRKAHLKNNILNEIKLTVSRIIEKSGQKAGWHTLKIRPFNHYIIRQNNLAAFIAKILFFEDDQLLNFFFTECATIKKSIDFTRRMLSDNEYGIGIEHSKIITANALLPFLFVCCKMRNDKFGRLKMMNMLKRFPGCLINYKLINICRYSGIAADYHKKSFISQLGLLYIYDNYCVKK